MRVSRVNRSLLCSNSVLHSSLMIRRDVMMGVGAYDERRMAQFDYDLLLRTRAAGHLIGHCNLPLVLHRRHAAQYFEGLQPLKRAWSSCRLQLDNIARERSPERFVYYGVAMVRLAYQVTRSVAWHRVIRPVSPERSRVSAHHGVWARLAFPRLLSLNWGSIRPARVGLRCPQQREQRWLAGLSRYHHLPGTGMSHPGSKGRIFHLDPPEPDGEPASPGCQVAVATPQYPQFDARVVGRTIWRWGWLIAGMVAVAFAVVYGLSKVKPEVYSANADVSVNTASTAIGGGKGSTDGGVLANEEYYAASGPVRAAGNAQLGAQSSQVLAERVTGVANTDVMRINVTSHSPVVAQKAANAYAAAYVTTRTSQLQSGLIDKVNQLISQANAYNTQAAALLTQVANDPQSPNVTSWRAQAASLSNLADQAEVSATEAKVASTGESNTVTVTKLASTPRYPISPTPLRDAGIAAVVALALGIGLAFLLEQLDNKVKTPEQVLQVTGGVPVLGSVPAYNDGHRHLSHRFHRAERALVAPTSVAAESYHALATSLRFSSLGKEKRTILVTSSVGEEGKTTVTANLAAVLAESGFRVVVVSADLRRPMLGELLHSVETEKGLTSAMLGDRELASCFASVPLPSGKNIFVLPAGPLPHEPAVLLGSDAFGHVLDQIKRSQADFILVDCAPVLPVSDPVAASRHVDGVIVLALAGETRQSDLAETVNRLRQVDADIIGVVLNGMPVRRGHFSYSGYYGYRAYQADTPVTPGANGSGPPSTDSTITANGSAGANGPGEVRPMTVKRSETEPGAASA